MKATIVLALATVCLLVLCNTVDAWPSDMDKAKDKPKDLATVVKDAKAKKKCAQDCGTAYDPICAYDPADSNYKPRTFGSQCALDVASCERGTKLVVKNKGECPGSSGVILNA